MPEGWAASAGGFPAMTEHVAFLIKDLIVFAASFYLLKEGGRGCVICLNQTGGAIWRATMMS